MNPAQKWAKSYFERLDEVLEKLKNHPLVQHIVCHRYQGLTNEEIAATEAELSQTNGEGSYQYGFDNYMKEFYKISNGLHLAWDSHIFASPLEKTEILTDADVGVFPVADDDHVTCGGFLSLLPLQYFVDHLPLPIYGSPRESRTAEALAAEGKYFTYLDFYNFYYDTCIAFHPSDPSGNRLYRGKSHSASYDDSATSDFVIYTEYLLATFFSITLRFGAFLPDDRMENYRADDYSSVISLIDSSNPYKNIDAVLKYDAIEEEMLENYGDLEYLQEKPKEIYDAIESLLKLTLEDEL